MPDPKILTQVKPNLKELPKTNFWVIETANEIESSKEGRTFTKKFLKAQTPLSIRTSPKGNWKPKGWKKETNQFE